MKADQSKFMHKGRPCAIVNIRERGALQWTAEMLIRYLDGNRERRIVHGFEVEENDEEE